MSRICKTFSLIASPTPFVRTRVINLSQQSNRFLYLEIIHVSDQLRSNQITMIYHVSSLMYHSSSNTYHASPLIYHQSFIISHLASIIYHRAPIIQHLSSLFICISISIPIILQPSALSPQPLPVSYFQSIRLNYDYDI